jgi:tetratricopeptide (TPR) repeat protein/transcriptional regulator with XRE-family HTH domain
MPRQSMHEGNSTTTPFGSVLIYYQVLAGLTRAELAEKSRLTVRYIEYLISGKRRPSEIAIGKLSVALGLLEHDRNVLLEAALSHPSAAQATLAQDQLADSALAFASLLKHFRLLRGLTQARLAATDKLDVSVRFVQQLEAGDRSPSMRTLNRVCEALRLSKHDRAVLSSAARGLRPIEAQPGKLSPPVYDPELPSIAGLAGVIGRHTELAVLGARLTTEKSLPYVALLGIPGVGKTTLAMAIAHDDAIREHFVDGVLWARLGEAPQISHQLMRWGSLLGASLASLTQATSESDLKQVLHEAVGERRLLLVIDDAWSFDDAQALFIGGTNCAVFVTTRWPRIALEVGGRDILVVRELDHAWSIDLLHSVAPILTTITTQQVTALEHSLVDWVGGLPLALTLIGRHLQAACGLVHGSSYYLGERGTAEEQLHASLHALEDARSRIRLTQTDPTTGRASSLQAVISVSAQRLSKQEEIALRSLAVFPPKPETFSRSAALHVGEMPDSVLDALIDFGLLESIGGERCTMHRTIRDYSRSQGLPDAAEHRMVQYFMEYAEQTASNFGALTQEQRNLLEALEIAFRRGLYSELTRTIVPSCDYLQSHGMHDVAETHLLRAEQAARESGDRHALVVVLQYRARNADRFGHSELAAEILKDAVAHAEESDDEHQVAMLLAALGDVTLKSGRYRQGEEYLLRARNLAERLGQFTLLSEILRSLNGRAFAQGEYDRALEYATQGLVIARQLGDPEKISTQLSAMGNTASIMGRYHESRDYLLQSLEIAEGLGHRIRMAYVRTNLGTVAINMGEYQQAIDHLNAALHLGEEMKHDLRVAFALANLAQVAIAQGRDDDAESLLKRALDLLEGLDRPDRVVDIYINLGVLELERGHVSRARIYLRTGWELTEAINYPEFRALLLRYLGECSLRSDKLSEARRQFTEALTIGRSRRHPEIISSARCAIGRLRLKEGQLVNAANAFRASMAAAPEHRELVATAHFGLAQVAAQTNDTADARIEGQTSLNMFEQLGHRRVRAVRSWLNRISDHIPQTI